MSARRFVQRHRALRWVAPVGVAGVAALAASGVLSAHATSRTLPQTTPTSLIAAVRTAHVDGFTGTLVSHLSLGLPQLPQIGDTGDGTSLTSLLSGSHTMQVWYGGATKQRIALLGTTDETDLFRNGSQLWEWDSAQRRATHTVLPAQAGRSAPGAQSLPVPSGSASSLTPQQLAQRALAALDPTTRVQVTRHATVADRSVYELVLTPRSATRIASVHIAVDGQTKMPLAVQVYAQGQSTPAIDAAFTSISYGVPAARNFSFTPPPDAHVRTIHAKRHHVGAPNAGAPSTGKNTLRPTNVHVTGTGWSRVLSASVPASAVRKAESGSALQALTPVSGRWGTGRLLDSSLLTVLVTSDGRVFAGAVDPSVLYTAAGTK